MEDDYEESIFYQYTNQFPTDEFRLHKRKPQKNEFGESNVEHFSSSFFAFSLVQMIFGSTPRP